MHFMTFLNIIMIIGTILHRQSLLNFYKSTFSVQNYMKTFQSKCVTRHHGYFRVDEYQHFDSNAQSLQKFVESERRLFQKESAKWKSLTQQYYQISSSRRDARTATIPEIYDHYEYYTRVSWHKGRQYSIIYRRPIGDTTRQELVLDIMQYPIIRRSFKTVELLKTSFSPSHRYVAFGVDLKNNQKTSFLLADTLSTKKQLLKIQEGDESTYRIDDVNDMIFAKQKEVFYLKMENHRPCRLVYQDLVSGKTQHIYQQTDAQYYLNIRLSKDKKYLILTGNSKQKSKIWIVDLTSQQINLIKVWEESSKVYLNHVEDHFIVWLQWDTSVIKLIGDQQFRQAAKRLGNKELNFKNISGAVIYTCEQEQVIEEIDIVQDNIVLYMQRINLPLLKVINYSKNINKQSGKDSPYKIEITNAFLPYNFGVINPGTNENFTADEIVFFMSTPFVFEEVYSYSISTKTCRAIQRYQHTGPKFPINKYQISHVDVPSTTMDYIPMTIIGPKKKATGKLLIHFYGFYGIPTRVGYDNVNIAALEKGWTIVYAHVRGGGEKGKRWHQQALGMNRDRTWKDIEECVGYLIKQRYTHPSLLFMSSHSAGAIALWNAINHKPNLYKGAIFKFPFLDVLTSLLDKSQPLSNTDYEQFGNPIQNKNSYQEIEAISPYQNIQCIEYPVIHIMAGQNDYRTPVNQVAKFVSRFRDRALESGRVQQIGIKGTTVDISSSASHLGEASIKDQNYKGCDVFGYMDYVLNKVSKDCKFID